MTYRKPRLIGILGSLKADSTSKTARVYGVYKCMYCGSEMLAVTTNVSTGKTTKCSNCRRNSVSPGNIRRIIMAAGSFAEKASVVHNGFYDYSQVAYETARKHVVVICPKHGPWLITPDNHLRGYGCNACACARNDALSRLSKEGPVYLYVLYLPDHNLWKVGCTERSVEARYAQERVIYTIVYLQEFIPGYLAYKLEQRIVQSMCIYKYIGFKVFAHTGNSELMTMDPVPIILNEMKQ